MEKLLFAAFRAFKNFVRKAGMLFACADTHSSPPFQALIGLVARYTILIGYFFTKA